MIITYIHVNGVHVCVKFIIYRRLILRVTFILRTGDKKYIMDIFYILISSPTLY